MNISIEKHDDTQVAMLTATNADAQFSRKRSIVESMYVKEVTK